MNGALLKIPVGRSGIDSGHIAVKFRVDSYKGV